MYIQCVGCIGNHILGRPVTLVLTADDITKTKNDVSVCKLDVDVKNQSAVVRNISCRNSLKEKVFVIIASSALKIKYGNQKVCKMKYLSWAIWYG